MPEPVVEKRRFWKVVSREPLNHEILSEEVQGCAPLKHQPEIYHSVLRTSFTSILIIDHLAGYGRRVEGQQINRENLEADPPFPFSGLFGIRTRVMWAEPKPLSGKNP